MSKTARSWVWKQKADPDAKLVLLALAYLTNDAGVPWPSEETLAEATNLPVSAVSAALTRLQRTALIQLERRGADVTVFGLNMPSGSDHGDIAP